MKLLFEGYGYAPESIAALLPRPYLQSLSDGTLCTLCVGYFYSAQAGEAVFILPKVFLDGQRLFYGRLTPEYLLEADEQALAELLASGPGRLLRQLPVWLHQALVRYRDSAEGRRSVTGERVPVMSYTQPDEYGSLLELCVSIAAFHRRHPGLLALVTATAARGKKIRWQRTVAHELPVITGGTPVYPHTLRLSRRIDYEEELLVLYHSTLEYLRVQYGFRYVRESAYPLLRPHEFRHMLSGYGTRYLRSIRQRYFRDVLVQLWKLLYAFFDLSARIRHAGSYEEVMLSSDFPVVFEAMVDDLISDDDRVVPRFFREQRDGKRVDHLFRGRDLLQDRDIFYIGDSKYYGALSQAQGQAVDKQYTYARNIIQYNIEALLPGSRRRPPPGVRYRDELTEGYNVTPNFFIRGVTDSGVSGDEGAGLTDPGVDDLRCSGTGHVQIQRQFTNRLFDRDTLMVLSYDISFIFVLRAYILHDPLLKDAFRSRARELFRRQTVMALNERYHFYRTAAAGDDGALRTFIARHYRLLIGKIYHTAGSDELLLALDRTCRDENPGILEVFAAAGLQLQPLTLT